MSSTEQAAVQGNSANIDMCAINVLAPISVEHAQPTPRNTKNMMMTKENQATNPPFNTRRSTFSNPHMC